MFAYVAKLTGCYRAWNNFEKLGRELSGKTLSIAGTSSGYCMEGITIAAEIASYKQINAINLRRMKI